jgi:hypothetical protein
MDGITVIHFVLQNKLHALAEQFQGNVVGA